MRNKARLLAMSALGLIGLDVLVNFSLAVMNTALNVTTFVVVALAMFACTKVND